MKQFLPKTAVLPQLTYDLVLFESTFPLLFTCVDSSGNMYVAVCYCSNGEQKCWALSPTTPEEIISFLTDKIAIRQLFDSETEPLFVVSLFSTEPKLKIEQLSFKDVNSDILPTVGCYLEADSNEYAEEIAILKKRIRAQADG